ncbi:hypothetical protein MTQ13_10060 [Streptomyces sp. XM4011]|uniref:hypothetical protein n=1 Tax=Streptomyces sp. XM4011 TaxID=2929780 RepID=UPI001FF962C6|nr:hypothetical protein [Streptomyces sp. XM4011]MCK1814616.1 hypothetical protein [Streptomyces sp. XM4011]
MSAKSDRVGRSGARTYSKHEVLNRFVGKEIAVINHLRMSRLLEPRQRLVWIDLTAGDAALQVESDDWRKNCSPGILAYHATWDRNTKPVEVILVEKNRETHQILIANLSTALPSLGYEQIRPDQWRHTGQRGGMVSLRVMHCDSLELPVTFLRPSDAVLLLNDPNGVPTWAMRETLPSEISKRTTFFRSFSTLGWNVAGAKAWATREDRIQRYDLIAPQIRHLGPRRDLCLAWIDRDDAQWSYLLETPQVWREQTDGEIRSAFGRNALDVEIAWYRLDPERFRHARMRMALTKVEYQAVRGCTAEWDAADYERRFELLGPEVRRPSKIRQQAQHETLFDLD